MFVISEHPPKAFEDFLAANGLKRYRARQILDWVYKRSSFNFAEFNNLPKPEIDFLEKNCVILDCELAERTVSRKDKTTKFLIRLADGHLIEAVLLYAPDAECSNNLRVSSACRSETLNRYSIRHNRLTACLSTQVGCSVSCTFCASGRSGFKRNLATAEIISQYLLIQKEAKDREKKVDNIVFMGIGEPLLNYKSLLAAVDLLTDPLAAAMAARRITISTAGVVPAIDRLSAYKKQVNLSISLHSGLDEKRNLLVPLNKKYSIATLIAAVKRYIAKTGRMVTFEYVLIKGVNDAEEDVTALRKALVGLRCKLNVIPYNPTENGSTGSPSLEPSRATSRGTSFKSPSAKDTQTFIKMLVKNKINAIQRQKKGNDINSGCGQLKASFFNK